MKSDVFTSKMFLSLTYCLILLALTSIVKEPFLTEAFPLKDCQNEDVDLLLVTDSYLAAGLKNQKFFLSELLAYFLQPDDVLQMTPKVAMATARLSLEPSQLFFFQFDNITDDVGQVPTLANSPSLSFQTYNTAEDVEAQINLFPVMNGIGLYVNDTLTNTCNSQDLLGGVGLNSSHVAAVIVGHLTTHVIERLQYKNGQWGRSCKFEMFLILVGHDITEKLLPQVSQRESQFVVPFLQSIGPSLECYNCSSDSSESELPDQSLREEGSCYFLHASDSPMSWFEATKKCGERGGIIALPESDKELNFVTFILNNYIEKVYQNKTSNAGPTDYVELLKNVYIGLKRNPRRTGSPFEWSITGDPLIYTHWIDTLPHGGPNERCGLWLYRRSKEWSEPLGRTIYNASNLEMNYNGWDDVGCGSRVTNLALCEFGFVNYKEYEKESLKASPANTDSFTRAISRGEFTNFQGKIISIPAFLQNSTYASTLERTESLFEVFSCDNGENGDIITIPYSYVCDHVEDCTFGQDETICYNQCYLHTEFTCKSGQCVPQESRCDVYTDCYDGSDEEDCEFCNAAMCCDGSCLPRHFVFDGEVDCIPCDVSQHDESLLVDGDLRDYDCPFICNRSECVTLSMLNDNITQCLGPEGPLDEIWGTLETVNTCKISFDFNGSLVEYVRWSPRCVYIKDRYDTVIGCRDMSHLRDCQNFTCPEGYVKCPDSYCIPLHFVGDGHRDCPHGLDEVWAANCTGNFQCWGELKNVCIHPNLVCDGYQHCPSGDDELNCHVSCAEGFRCIGGTVTVTDFDKSKPLQDISFIDKRTRYLDLSGVNLSTIVNVGNKEQFRNLVKLSLSNCHIANLDGNAIFQVSLVGVYALDLSYNLISTLSRNNTPFPMLNLHVLNLSHNRLLTSIPGNAWFKLERLNLAFTAVRIINNIAFKFFTKLKHLNLSYTQISVINQQSFPVELSLSTLDLRGTPLSNIEPNALTNLSVSEDLYSDLYKLCCPQVRGQGIPEHVCHAPASAISSCMDLIQEPAQRVLLWTVGVLAVTGNLVVITYRLLWDRAVLKRSYGLFVTNLSVSDLFMGVYLLIIAGTDVIYRDNYVWYESDWRHSTLCQTAGFLSTLSSETSAFFILLVTIDRFLVIKFPFGHFRFTRWSMIMSCVIAWSVGFVLALVPALPRFQHWQMYSSNGMCLGLPLTPDRRSGWEYSGTLFIGLNFIMFLFIACGQYLIYRALSENSLKTSSAVQSNAKRVQEIMVAKQLSLVVLSDFLCWFPIGIMGLLAMSGRDIGTEVYAWSAVLVLPINSALNPVLYTVPLIMKKWEDFKHGYKKTGASTAFKSGELTCETSS